MSGFLGHTHYNADSGLNNDSDKNSSNNNNNEIGGMHSHIVNGTAPGIPTIRNALIQSPKQLGSQALSTSNQQHAQPQSLMYDMSSFDPLQAQAFQLSASAGLTPADILAAASAPNMTPSMAPNMAPSMASAAPNNDGTNSVSVSNNAPFAGMGGMVSQPVPSYPQPLSQPPGTSIATVPCSGQLKPIQTVPSQGNSTLTRAQATVPNPYIFIQPQQLDRTATGLAPFAGAPAPNGLLIPATAPGAPSLKSTQAQAAAVAAATAGFGAHSLLFNPAFLAAAGFTAPANGALIQPQTSTAIPPTEQPKQHHRVQLIAAGSHALGHSPILPASAINLHPSATIQGQSKKRPLGSGVVIGESAPSVVSSTTVAGKDNTNKRQRQATNAHDADDAVSNNPDDPAEKRRYERNLREQQRSSKISSQIKELREVLADCNVPFKPNKYSILLKVVEYIKQLQSRAIMLDAEHQKLIATVGQTNQMIANNGNASTGGVTDNDSSDVSEAWQRQHLNPQHDSGSNHKESNLYFVKGIDYRSVFKQCPTAFGIAALDGRILECNVEFQILLGYNNRDDLLKQSLFNLVQNHQDIFRAMAKMLKTAEAPTTQSDFNNNADSNVISEDKGNNNNSSDRYWTGPVISKQSAKLFMNITLTSADNGAPKFFSCSLTNLTV